MSEQPFVEMHAHVAMIYIWLFVEPALQALKPSNKRLDKYEFDGKQQGMYECLSFDDKHFVCELLSF